MSYGPVQVYTVTAASAATSTGAAQLGKAYNKISVIIPTMASGSDVYFRGCESLSGTYRRIFHSPSNISATVAAQFVTSGVTNCIVPLQNVHVAFIKAELSTATTDNSYDFTFICSD